MRSTTWVFAVALSASLVGCGEDDAATAGGGGGGELHPPNPVVLYTQGEELDAYDTVTGEFQKIIQGNFDETNPDIPAVNGQICMFPDGSGRLVMGEDATQPNPPPHWSVIQLIGNQMGSITAEKVVDLLPTFQSSEDTPENHGCGFLADGRLLTADIGNQGLGDGDGQLIVWFPPFEGTPRYCKIDVTVSTAGGIFVDEQDRIYLTSARPGGGGVLRYTGPFPTSDDASGGCGRTDATGAPLADSVTREVFIPQDQHITTPFGIARNGAGHFYVASVFNGVIAEYDADGAFVRRLLEPPEGGSLGAQPYSTGTPVDLVVAPGGAIYYADLGVGVNGVDIGPVDEMSSFRRIRIVEGEPRAPETLEDGLWFADGVGLWQ